MNRRSAPKAVGVGLRRYLRLHLAHHQVFPDRRVWDPSRTRLAYQRLLQPPQQDGLVRARWDLFHRRPWAGRTSRSPPGQNHPQSAACTWTRASTLANLLCSSHRRPRTGVLQYHQGRPTPPLTQAAPSTTRHSVSKALAEFVKEGAKAGLRVAP